jgi:hypothetical protein
MDQQGIDDEMRSAAFCIARQISDGSLDQYPKDRKAAWDRLRNYVDCGVVTYEELGRSGNLCE